MEGFSGLSYAQIEDISAQLNNKATRMREILEAVTTELNKVGGDETWSGTAASAAFDEFNKLIPKFHEFWETTTECSKYLHRVVETYKSVDNKIMGQQ